MFKPEQLMRTKQLYIDREWHSNFATCDFTCESADKGGGTYQFMGMHVIGQTGSTGCNFGQRNHFVNNPARSKLKTKVLRYPKMGLK